MADEGVNCEGDKRFQFLVGHELSLIEYDREYLKATQKKLPCDKEATP